MQNPQLSQEAANQFTSSIAKDIIFCIITCFIYNVFWQAREMRAINYLLGEERYSFVKWALLTLITCGIYHIYFQYIFARSIMETQTKHGIMVSANIDAMSVFLTIFGLSIVADAIQQKEINKFFGK